MIIHPPCQITARLLPGIRVNDAFISIEYFGRTPDRRQRYRYYIDHKDFEYEAADLSSGVGGGSLQQGLESLLSFLSNAGEVYAYKLHSPGDGDDDSFTPSVTEWAYNNRDELSLLGMELEETPNLIEEGFPA